MTGLPVLTGAEVVRALERAGFVVVRISGSHHRMVHSTDAMRATTVPLHGGKTLKRGTLRGAGNDIWFLRAGLLRVSLLALRIAGFGRGD